MVHFTDSDGFGGAEEAVFNTLANLDRQRWAPVLFHHSGSGIEPLLTKVRRLNLRVRTVPRIESIAHSARLREFIRVLRAERPTIFHAHLTWPLSCKYGLIAAILARVPVVVATVQLYVKPPERFLLYTQMRFVTGGVDRYIAVSEGVARQLSRSLPIPASKIRVVHNGIAVESFERPGDTKLRSKFRGAVERPIVLTIARLEEQKGIRYLLEAAARVPEALFVLAGEGSERGRLEAQARKSGLEDRIIFLGYREDIADLLASCDLFVLPSLFEGFPLAILEAMAAGKPVITTAIDGNDEAIVEGETGLLVPPANPAALSEAIRSLLANPNRARALAMHGKARVQRHFSAQTSTAKVTQIYDELTKFLQPSGEVPHRLPL